MHRAAAIKVRTLLMGFALLAVAIGSVGPVYAQPASPPHGQPFRPWVRGGLDIHHIATGRGSATFAILADGTTLMIDAGAIYSPLKYTIAPRPDASRRPGEWLARYVDRRLREAGLAGIDYLVPTHLHNDHIGEFQPGLPLSANGDYALTGITDVAEQVPIGTLLDRGYPDYAFPPATSYLGDAAYRLTVDNYRRFVSAREARGEAVARVSPGSGRQIALRHAPEVYPDSGVRVIAANGQVWTGQGEETRSLFPDLETLPRRHYPTENQCSVALRIEQGGFSYYTGGDLGNDVGFEGLTWRDVETPIARATGRVSVAVANHHGYVDSMGPECVRALRPRAFVILGWDSAHPTIQPLYNMLSRELYPEERAVFLTAVKEENVIATRDLAKLASLNGHVVVRVPPGGATFTVEILDNTDEADRVLAVHGPWPSR